MTTVSESAETSLIPPGALLALRRIIGLELRDPLQVLLIDGLRVGRDSAISEQHRQMSLRIAAAARRLAQLQLDAEDLLGGMLGRPLELRHRPCNADTICRAAILHCKTRSSTLSVEYHPQGDPTGEWDGARVQRALELLLEDAVQPEIRLTWHRAPRSDARPHDWVIEVERFVSEATLAELHARRVAQAHAGSVETESHGAGKQRLRMRLPCRSFSPPVD